MPRPSLCDGPGYRTVLFLQGCDKHCEGCHNKRTWDIHAGTSISVNELEKMIREKCKNKKLTISGGEPLLQIRALEELLEKLTDFDICLYTGRDLKDVPYNILKYLKYVKYGPYMHLLHTTTTPYVGSTNQVFKEVIHIEKSK